MSPRQPFRNFACGARVIAFVGMLLAGCAVHGTGEASHLDSVKVIGVVEDICAGCDIVDLVNGSTAAWDVLTVRVRVPETLSGTTISARVLLEGDRAAQRTLYRPSSSITFLAAKAALDVHDVMLQSADIESAD